jgi:hypothetical protein
MLLPRAPVCYSMDGNEREGLDRRGERLFGAFRHGAHHSPAAGDLGAIRADTDFEAEIQRVVDCRRKAATDEYSLRTDVLGGAVRPLGRADRPITNRETKWKSFDTRHAARERGDD